MNSKIEIPLSRAKIIGLLIGAVSLVILGVLFIISPDFFVSPIMRSSVFIRILGIAGVVFFGLCFVFLLKAISFNKIGLSIDQYGITDNTNATSVGLVEWADITGIAKKQVMSSKFLILYVHNPQKYINKAKNIVAKRAMEINYKTYGSPISIISNSLKISVNDLEKLLIFEFEKRKITQKDGDISQFY